jgi:hypothetical protein
MFQYALGRVLALKKNTHLLLDTSYLEKINQNHSYRKYSLNPFNIRGEALKFNRQFEKDSFLNRLLISLRIKRKINYLSETGFNFNPDIFRVTSNTYLDGYWQSYKYFEADWEMIKHDFLFSPKLIKEENSMLEKIKSSNSVFVHVRRGDYVSNKETNLYHGDLGEKYYHFAEKEIVQRVKNPVYFVFSDDINWVKENIKFNGEQHFAVSSSAADHDLYLMLSCQHAIIANSSFSWWGAWLIDNPGKVVIAPSKWFANSSIDTSDLCPESWRKI